MEFAGVENHDDFYSFDCDESAQADEMVQTPTTTTDRKPPSSYITAAPSSPQVAFGVAATPHVQDQKGYFIMYEEAIEDFQKLEEELLLMASHYIENDVGKFR